MSPLRPVLLFALPWALCGALSAQEPAGTHRSQIGHLVVTTLLDTEMQLPTNLLKGIEPKEVERIYQGQATTKTPANAFLVATGKHLVLVDTGGSKAMNPDMGHIQERLAALGVKPESIEAVLITHCHGDHTGGLLTADGKMAFPNAVIRLAQAEADYWLDPKTRESLPEARRPMVDGVKAAFAPYQAAGHFKPFGPHEAPFPGVEAIPAPGHTPGSTVYAFEGKVPFLAVGDIVHFGAVQFQHPEAFVGFDWNGEQALQARKRIWARAAKEHLVLGAAHLAFPGVGHVIPDGKTYKWQPLP